MLFNSWQYGIFFPVIFILYWFIPKNFRWFLLFIASYYFYMSWSAKYVVLILFTTVISYLAGILIDKSQNQRLRKIILILTFVSCLGVLFVFKYFNFFSETFTQILNAFSIKLHPVTLNLLLPVGISFYTFQTLGYVLDVYRKNITPEKNFGIYATFISFFPQLVAGPIERSKNLLPQIKNAHEKIFNYEQAAYGIKLMTFGFFKKLVIADVIAIQADRIFADIHEYEGFALILAVIFFTVQIYCDFSGYSDIARGCAKMLGIELMENFKSPYFSASIHEFWARWHISLSTWFRDYLYIPLGGNRCSKLRHYFNVLITFLISGLWHGANLTFLIWGFVHGAAQIFENMFTNSKRLENYPHNLFWWLRVICVFMFVVTTWTFFRANTINEAVYIFQNCFNGLSDLKSYLIAGSKTFGGKKIILFVLSLLALFDYFSLKHDVIKAITSSKYLILRYAFYFGLVTMILFFRATNEVDFVYFQF